MGFIDWYGERSNIKERFDEVKEYAQMVEEEEKERAYQKKLSDFASKICGTPEMIGLSREDTIKVLVSGFNRLKDVYDVLVKSKNFSWDYDLWLPYKDFWLYTIFTIIFSDDSICNSSQKEKVFDVINSKIFKLNDQIGREEYIKNTNECEDYLSYMRQSFELSKRDAIYFWKWIGYLSKEVQVENIATDFVEDFYTLLLRTIYFINVLLRSTEVGIKYAQKRNEIKKNIYNQLEDNKDLGKITVHLVNPVYARNRSVKEAVEYRELKNSKLHEWKEKVSNENADLSGGNRGETNHDSYVKIRLDKERINSLVEKRTLVDFAEVYNILLACKLPDDMEQVCKMISEEIYILQDTIIRFQDIYQVELDVFYDYYMPESINLISSYVDYVNARVEDRIINEAKVEVMNSSQQLLGAIVDMKNELYKFGSMELKARSKALESVMNQDGHINSDYKL